MGSKSGPEVAGGAPRPAHAGRVGGQGHGWASRGPFLGVLGACVCVCQQGTREAGRLGEVWIGGKRGKREPKEIPEVGDLSGHVWPELLRFLPVREPVRRRGHGRPPMSSGCVAALRR